MLTLKVNDEISLADLKVESAQALFNLIETNRRYLGKWLNWVDETRTIDDTILYIQTISDNDIFSARYVFGIYYKNNLAGLVDFHHGDRFNRKVEIGYWLAEEYQGNGIITDSCRALIKYAFEKTEINRIVIRCAECNDKSRAVPLRLDFKFEGVEREGQYLNGEFSNIMVYSLLKKEWK